MKRNGVEGKHRPLKLRVVLLLRNRRLIPLVLLSVLIYSVVAVLRFVTLPRYQHNDVVSPSTLENMYRAWQRPKLQQVMQVELTLFYHVYVPPVEYNDQAVASIKQARKMVRQHLNQMADSFAVKLRPRQLYYTSVGHPRAAQEVKDMCQVHTGAFSSCTHLRHAEVAYEEETLAALKDYCRQHPTHHVAYLHSKGTFHNKTENQHWRRYMTQAVLSRDCLSPPDDRCHVCGLAYNMMPGFMFRGNFWTAKCEYVNQLLPLGDFATGIQELGSITRELEDEDRIIYLNHPSRDQELGLGRFTNEHWIASHPSIVPCDMSPTASILHWMKADTAHNHSMRWHLAPRHHFVSHWDYQRYGLDVRRWKQHDLHDRDYYCLPSRILRWAHLYGEFPPDISYVWTWFPDGEAWRRSIRALPAVRTTHAKDLLIELMARISAPTPAPNFVK